MKLDQYATQMGSVLRFGTEKVSLHPKRIKDPEQAENDGVEPTKPHRVGFLDGAKWPEPSEKQAQALADQINADLMLVVRPIRDDIDRQIAQILAHPMIEKTALDVIDLISRAESMDEPMVLVRQERDSWYVGLNAAWAIYIDDTQSAKACAKQLHDALGRFRRSALNTLRCQMADALRIGYQE